MWNLIWLFLLSTKTHGSELLLYQSMHHVFIYLYKYTRVPFSTFVSQYAAEGALSSETVHSADTMDLNQTWTAWVFPISNAVPSRKQRQATKHKYCSVNHRRQPTAGSNYNILQNMQHSKDSAKVLQVTIVCLNIHMSVPRCDKSHLSLNIGSAVS